MEKLAYTIADVMKMTGLGKTTLYKHIEQGHLKKRKIGGRTVFILADVQEFLGADRPFLTDK
jgi:excisionase family DNA binding protein